MLTLTLFNTDFTENDEHLSHLFVTIRDAMLCNIVYQESRNVSRLLHDTKGFTWYKYQTRLTTVRSATNPVDNHWQAGGSWADKERTVIAGRQCRLEAGTPAIPSLRSPFHSPSRPSCHISLASKPISYLNLHLRFLTFAAHSTIKYIPESPRCFLGRLYTYLYLFMQRPWILFSDYSCYNGKSEELCDFFVRSILFAHAIVHKFIDEI